MKLHELQDEAPLAWTQLRKLLAAGRKVMLVVRKSYGHSVIGPIDEVVTDPAVGTDGQELFRLYYRTNDVFLSNYERDQIERAEIKRLRDLNSTDGELCFIVPSKLSPPID